MNPQAEATTSRETIDLRVDGGAATVVLNRPETLNAWNIQFGEELLATLEELEADESIRAVMITGAGRGFSSGADLKAEDRAMTEQGRPDVRPALRNHYNPLIATVRRMPKPVLASVNGPAVGIGCSLALVCDLIVAAESAYFQLAFANIGLTIDGGASATLAARIGHTRAAELAMLAERLPAPKALEWGMINRVFADDELAAESQGLLAQLASGPTGSYAATKRLLNARLYAGLEDQLELEVVEQQQRAESDDFIEGVLAFMQKRPPDFKPG